jgi:hypothetical protein
VYEVTLSAGQVLVARGDWIHCGLNLTPYSIGPAINFEDETGMLNNPMTIIETCRFVAKHHAMINPQSAAWAAEWAAVHPSPVPVFYDSPRIWELVLLNIPYYWTCCKLRGQRLDLWKHLSGAQHRDIQWVEEIRARKLLYVAAQEENERGTSDEQKQIDFEAEADLLDFSFTPQFKYTKSNEALDIGAMLIESKSHRVAPPVACTQTARGA